MGDGGRCQAYGISVFYKLQSLSVVETEDFKDMKATIDPGAVVPSRKHLSSKLLEEKSTEIREQLMKAFDKVSRLPLQLIYGP